MKNILILVLCLIISNISFAQEKLENTNHLSGIWIGKAEGHPIKFEILEKTPKSFIFSFINFQNERFTILKSDITTNEKKEFVISIKEAKFSSKIYEGCIFSTGTITLSDVTDDSMKLNLTSVGPTCFLSYDVLGKMDDIKDLTLTKDKSNK